MINNKTVLAIIPARGGSKGILKKNIKLLNGKPLIAYTIEESLKSKYIDRVIVSTEDPEIAKISLKYGAEVPFFRPQELALDDTPGIDPILNVINTLKEKEKYFSDYTICLQCTSPFRKSYNIDEALELLSHNEENFVVSVCESEITPYWMKKIENGMLKDFMAYDKSYYRRQNLPTVYRLNGAIYAGRTDKISESKNWYNQSALSYIMKQSESIDIDNMLDLKFAEFIMKDGYYE